MKQTMPQDAAPRIIKRDGRKEPFNPAKITSAIQRAGEATGEFGEEAAERLAFKTLALIRHLHDTAELTVEQVQTFCRANMPSFRMPREVEFLPELPKNATGKVLIQALKNR